MCLTRIINKKIKTRIGYQAIRFRTDENENYKIVPVTYFTKKEIIPGWQTATDVTLTDAFDEKYNGGYHIFLTLRDLKKAFGDCPYVKMRFKKILSVGEWDFNSTTSIIVVAKYKKPLLLVGKDLIMVKLLSWKKLKDKSDVIFTCKTINEFSKKFIYVREIFIHNRVVAYILRGRFYHWTIPLNMVDKKKIITIRRKYEES